MTSILRKKPHVFPLLRLAYLSIALAILIVPFSALAISQQRGGNSSAIGVIEDEPDIKGYSVNPTLGQVPVDIHIEIVASAATQMKVETEHGERLMGAESLSTNANNDRVFKLTTTFSDSYEGLLYIYLKTQDQQWIKADIELSVCYTASPEVALTPIPTHIPVSTFTTPNPTPTPTASYVTLDTVFTATASSVYKLKYNNEYTVGPDMAVDNKLYTAWNEGASGTGIGEWIWITPADGREYTYNGFWIANGFQYHNYHKGDRWKKNNRVASLNVYADGTRYIGTYAIADLYDGFETIYFQQPVTCRTLKFEISSVWEGKQFSDTCISELRPF